MPPNVTPGLSIVKTGVLDDLNGNGLLNLGETIRYSFQVVNTGGVTLTGVTVVDPLVPVIEPPQTLAPGGTYRFTAIYTPVQADIDAGAVTNVAYATGTPPSGPDIDSPTDTVTIPPDNGPGLSIVKTGTLNDLDGNALINLGETIGYRFLVTNTGLVTLTDVTVSDALVAVLEPAQTLAPGGSFTFTALYTPVQADIDAGAVTNVANATGQPPTGGRISSPPDTVTIPPFLGSGLEIDKTGTLNDRNGDGLLDGGETISYSFLVTNTGAVTLTDVTVNDPLVTVSEPVQTLAPGASFTFTANYLPTQANVDAGSVTNTARAIGTPPSGPSVLSPPDTVTVPAASTPGLRIIKTGTLNDTNGNSLIDVGESVEYRFTVTNTGAVTLTGVTVNDALVTVVEVPQTLAPGGSFTFTGSYTAVQGDIDAGYVENTATGTGVPPVGPPTISPPDTVIVPPNVRPALGIQKSAALTDANSNDLPEAGEIIEYEFRVTNTGTVTLTNVVPRDAGPRFGGVVGGNALSAFVPAPVTLLPGASQQFTASYEMTQADIDNAGRDAYEVNNLADATGLGPNGRPVVSSLAFAQLVLPTLPPTAITLTKQAGKSQVWRGDTIPFTIILANSAPTNAGLVDVVDTIPPGFRFVDGSATVNGAAATPSLSGSQIRFVGVPLGPRSEVEIRLSLLALATASPGRHINRVNALDPTGTPLVPEAVAMFELISEAILDCSEIVGKVFDDLDRDGYQDQGEPGLPAVRLATVRGVLITTDAHGRFSIPCAAMPDSNIGSNFVLKLDTRTLPTGYGLTTDNPAVVRLTAGKMTDVNFGASIGRQVRLDLSAVAFRRGTVELVPVLVTALDGVIELLAEEPTTLILTYGDSPSTLQSGMLRLDAVEAQVRDLWRRAGAPYELVITRQTTGNQGGQQ